MCFLVLHFLFICIFPIWQIGASISMGSNLSFLGVVLILELDLFFPVL